MYHRTILQPINAQDMEVAWVTNACITLSDPLIQIGGLRLWVLRVM